MRTRTIPPQPKGFGLPVRTRMPQQKGTDYAVEHIKEYMIPALEKEGYGSRIITGETIKRKQKEKDFESYSSVHPRLLLSDAGIFLEIWPFHTPKYQIVVKPFVIQDIDTSSIGNRPRIDLNNEILMALASKPPAIHIKLIHHMFFALDLRFLIMSQTGQFWIDTFTSIPEQQWMLTYRKDPNKLDRIAIKAKGQDGKFTSIKKELKNRLLTEFYYFNQNNKYGNQQSTTSESTGNSQTRTRRERTN